MSPDKEGGFCGLEIDHCAEYRMLHYVYYYVNLIRPNSTPCGVFFSKIFCSHKVNLSVRLYYLISYCSQILPFLLKLPI